MARERNTNKSTARRKSVYREQATRRSYDASGYPSDTDAYDDAYDDVFDDYAEEDYSSAFDDHEHDYAYRRSLAAQGRFYGESTPQVNRYDRASSSGRYGAQISKRNRRNRRYGVIRKLLVVVVLALVLGAGGAFAYVNYLDGNLSSGLDSTLNQRLVKTNLVKEPFYMLLMGTDASLERENDPTYAELFRTDTIVLARIDPVDKKVTLVSLPRDTWVDMEEDGIQKLNATYAIGGASAAVEEVSDLSGVGISHFCLVDMDGLKQVVDALGGIEVDVPMTIDDVDAGGHVDSGLHTLNGDEALILCRARAAYEDVGAGDSFRAANQRLVLQAIANKILASDIGTIADTVTTLSNYVTTDLTVREIVSLAQAFQGMDAESSMYTASMPTYSEYIDELWYEIIDDEAWQSMMSRVDQGLPPTDSTEIDAVTGTVLANAGSESDGSGNADITKSGLINVRNGTSQDGLGEAISQTLQGQGYTVIDVANADVDTYETSMVIYTENKQEAEARQIAKAIGGAEVFQNDGSYVTHDDFLVVVGADKIS